MDYLSLKEGAVPQAFKSVGQPAILRRIVAGTVDPITSTVTDEVSTDYPCDAVESEFTIIEVDGTRIQAGDKKVFVSAPGSMPEPSTTDTLLLGSIEYNILSCRPISPAGITLLYTLQVRR